MNDVVSQLVIKKTTTIEIPLTKGVAARTEVIIANQETKKLDGKLIYGWEVVSAAEQSVSASGRTVVPNADIPNLMLTIVEAVTNLQFVIKQPATRYQPSRYNGYTQVGKPRFWKFSETKFLIAATGTMTTSMSILLTLYWKDAEE